MTYPVSYYTDTCPKQVPVTVEEITNIIGPGSLTFNVVFTLDGSGNKIRATIGFQLVDNLTDRNPIAQQVALDLRFVDNANESDTPTVAPPDSPGWRSKRLHTDANGYLELIVDHTSALDTWYLIADLGGLVGVCPTALTLGV